MKTPNVTIMIVDFEGVCKGVTLPSVFATYKKTKAKRLPLDSGSPCILMVSGGADSLAMSLRILHGYAVDLFDGRGAQLLTKERLHILHVNHGIRGLSAQEDAEYVESFAARFGIAFTLVQVDTPAQAKASGLGLEAAARELRYEVAERLADTLARKRDVAKNKVRILVAHNADDVAETFLMRAFTGAGPKGLGSIPQKRGRIVRPFLSKTHAENCEYLQQHGEFWCEDETNQDTTYTRNYVRQCILEPANKRFSHASEHMLQSARLLSDENAYLEGIVRTLWPELIKTETNTLLSFDAKKLQALDVVLARRLLRRAFEHFSCNGRIRFDGEHVEAVLKAVAKDAGKLSLPGNLLAEVSRGYFTLSVAHESLAGWLSVPGFLDAGAGCRIEARVAEVSDADMALQLVQSVGKAGAKVALFDYDALKQPKKLWIENPRKGEVMQPFGMKGQTKRVSSVLSEAGLPKEVAGRVLVIKDVPDGAVLALLGVRQSERGKVSRHTRRLLLVKRL